MPGSLRTRPSRDQRRDGLSFAGSISFGIATSLVLLGAAPIAADIITLTNGREIVADRAWYEGQQVRYIRGGGAYGLPRSSVRSLDQSAPFAPSTDPEVLRGRSLLADGNPTEAFRAAQAALRVDPSSIAALQLLAESQIATGDPRGARQTLDKARQADEGDPRTLAALGHALSMIGDRPAAENAYRKSLALHPDAALEARIKGLAAPSIAPAGGTPTSPLRVSSAARPLVPRLPNDIPIRLRYEGSVNEVLGMAVLETLAAAYREFTQRLGVEPSEPVTVELLMGTTLSDARLPEWAEGSNDGTIRIPVAGLDRPTPRLVRVLRHELAHSFVSSRTGRNCPVWLQEGIAQWLEGGDPARDDAALASQAREGRLPALLRLEAPFRSLDEADATTAYSASLSAVAHILRLRGEGGLSRLLAALGDSMPSEEALPVALALSYPEFQRSWEEHIRLTTVRSGTR